MKNNRVRAEEQVRLRIYTKLSVHDHGTVHSLTKGGDGSEPENTIIWSELVAAELRPRE